MRYLLGPDLFEALGEKFNADLLVEAFKIHNIKWTVHWVKESNLDDDCWDFITFFLKWNPETTLVYYTPRRLIKETITIVDGHGPYVKLIKSLSNDDDNLCIFIPNKTPEELITLFCKTIKMKAFL